MRKSQFSDGGIKHATINGHRFHLRLNDPTEDNFLWIDGQQPPLVLDETAANFMSTIIEAMWQFQQGEGNESNQVISYVTNKMYEKYGKPLAFNSNRVTKGRIKADLHRLFGTIFEIAEGNCPVIMGLESKGINYGQWLSPARMDLAVTYRCNLNCGKCYLGSSKIPELSLNQWKKVYTTLWNIGIPQVVFTGGEPTLRDDIVDLVYEADEFVTGMVTNGTKLVCLAQRLKDASLDYVQITIESHDAAIHDQMTRYPGSHGSTTDGIRAALKAGLQVVTNTTLTKENAATFTETIKWLKNLGVSNIACNTLICSGRGTSCKAENGLSDYELAEILDSACDIAETNEINLQWYSPSCYNKGLDPVKFGFGVKSCSAAAHNMTIQPDGSILPCQSWPKDVGNILKDDWEKIWNHPTCLDLRSHRLADLECKTCTLFNECGGGCPLDKSERRKEN
ncbi:MAG: radical SAM protein [Patescibacteria group bacterium]